VRIVTHAAASQSQSSLAQFERVDAGHPQIDGFRLNVKAILCDSRGVSTERFVRRRSAVAADDVDLATGMSDRGREIVKDIVQTRIEMANVACPMIAEEIIELGERTWKVPLTMAVNNIDPLSGVRVV